MTANITLHLAERAVGWNQRSGKSFDQYVKRERIKRERGSRVGRSGGGSAAIIHKDKWMCHRGSAFSDAISSSHLLLDSFQVDSLQDAAAIFRGQREGGGNRQMHVSV